MLTIADEGGRGASQKLTIADGGGGEGGEGSRISAEVICEYPLIYRLDCLVNACIFSAELSFLKLLWLLIKHYVHNCQYLKNNNWLEASREKQLLVAGAVLIVPH